MKTWCPLKAEYNFVRILLFCCLLFWPGPLMDNHLKKKVPISHCLRCGKKLGPYPTTKGPKSWTPWGWLLTPWKDRKTTRKSGCIFLFFVFLERVFSVEIWLPFFFFLFLFLFFWVLWCVSKRSIPRALETFWLCPNLGIITYVYQIVLNWRYPPTLCSSLVHVCQTHALSKRSIILYYFLWKKCCMRKVTKFLKW